MERAQVGILELVLPEGMNQGVIYRSQGVYYFEDDKEATIGRVFCWENLERLRDRFKQACEAARERDKEESPLDEKVIGVIMADKRAIIEYMKLLNGKPPEIRSVSVIA